MQTGNPAYITVPCSTFHVFFKNYEYIYIKNYSQKLYISNSSIEKEFP